MEKKIRDIIASSCLKHKDSGEASVDRQARLIMNALEDSGYRIVPSDTHQKAVNMVDEISRRWYPYEDGVLENGDTGEKMTSEDFVNRFVPELAVKCSWFINRIGKRVYRCATSCDCDSCRENTEKGIVIRDEEHASHLCNASAEMGIKYYDSPPEK